MNSFSKKGINYAADTNQVGWDPGLQMVSPKQVLASGQKRYAKYDDSVVVKYPVADAVCLENGSHVIVKHIASPAHSKRPSQELDILNLASPELKNHPQNPCPLLITSFPLENPDNKGLSFIRQMLEALVFFHDRNIAHRDIRLQNIIMDTSLYPNGMNPLVNLSVFKKDLPHESKHLDRIDTNSQDDRAWVINDGAALMLDEFYTLDGEVVLAPHDPFKADALQLGAFLDFAFAKDPDPDGERTEASKSDIIRYQDGRFKKHRAPSTEHRAPSFRFLISLKLNRTLLTEIKKYPPNYWITDRR
uniref:Protein kinase domain-containing protein n=1 Tax=Moniliophthora roreri TaxID=221103 RepID=A0A0W0F4Y3_MONRR